MEGATIETSKIKQMLVRAIGYNKWFMGLQTMLQFDKAAVLVESKPVWREDVPANLFEATMEHVSSVWVYVLFREENNRVIQVTASLGKEHAFEAQHLLFQYLQQHQEEWLKVEAFNFSEEWISRDLVNDAEGSFSEPLLSTPCPPSLPHS